MSPDTARRSPRGWILAGAAVLVTSFAWLLYGGLDNNVVFFLTPTELLARGTRGVGVPVRLGGLVKPGTLKWEEKSLELRFAVVDSGGAGEIAVVSKGQPPQMFREGMGVVLDGRFGRDGVFQCTGLMVKHSNEYRAPKDGERPQEMYKSLIKGTSE